MTMMNHTDRDARFAPLAESLERDRNTLVRIIERRMSFVEAIDWSLMTETDREYAFVWKEAEHDHELSFLDHYIAHPRYLSWLQDPED